MNVESDPNRKIIDQAIDALADQDTTLQGKLIATHLLLNAGYSECQLSQLKTGMPRDQLDYIWHA